MRHVRIWIRGYAFEVEHLRCWDIWCSSRLLRRRNGSAHRHESSRKPARTKGEKKKGKEEGREAKRSQNAVASLLLLEEEARESTNLILAGVSREICKTIHVSVVLMRLLDARRRQRESFADAHVRYYEFFNTIESRTREKFSNARNHESYLLISPFYWKTVIFYKWQREA